MKSQLLKNAMQTAKQVLMIGLLVSMAACASTSSAPLHSFEFDAINDSPGILILAYRYGDSEIPALRDDEATAARRNVLSARQTGGVGAFMRPGADLYVKWKIKATGEVFEDRVDLQSRLPQDIKNHTIYFVVEGRQLVVYLISPDTRSQSAPRTGPGLHKYYQSSIIYPDQRRTTKQ